MPAMRVAILGFSDLEQSESLQVYRYFKQQGADISAYVWGSPQVPADVHVITVEKDTVFSGLDDFDLLVRGPAVHPRQLPTKTPITSLTNIFLEQCPTKNLIGITGTKGKGTTSTLVAKMLQTAGHRVHLGGNIGVPLLDDLPSIATDDWVVLEMSNFQLIDSRRSPHIAACLLVVPEHLDWHADAAEYYAAKANMFSHQTAADIAIYNAQSPASASLAAGSPGVKVPYFAPPGAYVDNGAVTIDGQQICQTSDIKLLGQHNWQNVCAAITVVWQAGLRDAAAIRSVITTFTGLPHRIEFVRDVNGIRYYNDSFATGLHATSAAVSAIPGKLVLIVGGYDRMLSLTEFAKFVHDKSDVFRSLLVIGASGQRLIKALQAEGVTNYTRSQAKTMSQIIADAQSLAVAGDAIVLSPGFASFDMFKNFEDRGTQFKQVVAAL